jgi:hypothetical protein
MFLCIFLFSFLHCLCVHASQWESSTFIWNFGLIAECDKGMHQNPEAYFEKATFDKKAYQKIKKGDLIWVKSGFLKKFYRKILPEIKDPFILVISDGDESFPSNSELDNEEIKQLINHRMIIHIFAQNCDYQGPHRNKVSAIPLGVDFHTIAFKKDKKAWGNLTSPSEQEAVLKEVIKTLKPTDQRKKRAFVDFQHFDSMRLGFQRYLEFGEDRTAIFQKLKTTHLIDYGEKMPRSDLWKTKGEYAFSISPPGNGLDCHRTWEDLILGCIVIVRTSPMDSLYDGLPVVIVKDWSEITEENLTLWLEQYKDAFTNPSYRKRLTNAYWVDKMRAAKELLEKKR